MPGPLLVLWDVDHTLISTGNLGHRLYRAAFQAATGKPLDHPVDVSGRTEQAIAADTLRANGIDATTDMIQRYQAALTDQYRDHSDDLREHGRALPGVGDILRVLAGHAGVVQTLLTGNVRAVATITVGAFGLTDHLDLDVGAYAEDHLIRAALVP